MRIPWGVNRLHNIFCDRRSVSAGLPDGRYVTAVQVPYCGNLFERLRAAWWVFTGRAHALIWPEAGDLEAVTLGHPYPPTWMPQKSEEPTP